jgi:DeoR/GlpR family transcriptional regulator of sugar metabolism
VIVLGAQTIQERTTAIPPPARAKGHHRLAETRRRAIEDHVRSVGAVSVAEVEERFGVSAMTARRDLAELERRGSVRRTHGGAVIPGGSDQEDSFAQRLEVAVAEKRRFAETVAATLADTQSVFLDASTTSYFVARRLIQTHAALTILTNSLPIVDLLFREGRSPLEVIAIGGTLRRLNRSFVGPTAVRSVRDHFADRLIISVKAIADNGILTEADPLEAEVKREMIAQAGESILLVEPSKLAARGLTAIAPISQITSVVAIGLSSEAVNDLRVVGAKVQTVTLAPDDS